MICPYCNTPDQIMTLETRSKEWGMKRMKKCLKCGGRFPTIEVYDVTDEALNSLNKSKKIQKSKRSK